MELLSLSVGGGRVNFMAPNEETTTNASPFATHTKHPRVWHYTDAVGFLGILTTESIWATSPKALNDYKEITYGVDKIQKAIDALKGSVTIAAEVISQLEEVLSNEFLDKQSRDVFVLSASSNGDLLNQWQHYSDVDGFALEIDTKIPLGIRESDGTTVSGRFPHNHFFPGWYDVIYTDEEHDAVIKDILNFAFQMADNPKLSEQNIFNLVNRIALTSQITRIKHQGFQDEREVRYLFGGKESTEVHYRSYSGRMVPYVELVRHREENSTNTSNLDFIKGVVCSPTMIESDVELVREMLESFKLSHLTVARSDIPFRK